MRKDAREERAMEAAPFGTDETSCEVALPEV